MRPRVGTKGWAPLEVEQKDEKDKKERKKDAVVQNWCLTSRVPYKDGGFIGGLMCLAEGTVLCERHKKLMHQRFRGREPGVVRYFSPAGHPTPYDGAVAHRWNTIFLGRRRGAGGLLFSDFGLVRVVMIYWVGGPSPGKWIIVSANTPPLGTPHCGICGPPVKIVALDLDNHGDRSENGQISKHDRPSRSRVTALCDRTGF